MIKPLLAELRTKVENARGLTNTTKVELLQIVQELECQPAGQHRIDQLRSVIREIEVSHPDITDVANRIATMLANIGI